MCTARRDVFVILLGVFLHSFSTCQVLKKTKSNKKKTSPDNDFKATCFPRQIKLKIKKDRTKEKI